MAEREYRLRTYYQVTEDLGVGAGPVVTEEWRWSRWRVYQSKPSMHTALERLRPMRFEVEWRVVGDWTVGAPEPPYD